MILRYFPPGLRFRVRDMPELTGVLLKVNDCRACVRYDRPLEFVTFTDAKGRTRTMEARNNPTDITPFLEVQPI